MKFVKDLFRADTKHEGKKNFFLLMIVFALAATLYTGGILGIHFFRFASLNKEALATNLEMRVVEGPHEQYLIEAEYAFYDGNGELQQAKNVLQNRYPNRFLAEKQKEEMLQYQWKVFFKKTRPEKNALQKLFPFKKMFHFVISLGVLIYFLLLQQTVQRKYSFTS